MKSRGKYNHQDPFNSLWFLLESIFNGLFYTKTKVTYKRHLGKILLT